MTRTRREKRSSRGVPEAAGNESITQSQRGKRSSGRGPDAARNKNLAEDSLNQRIARIASAQRGTITRAQLLELGLDGCAIDRRANDGALHRVHRGVYLVGHEALAPHAREAAALLACGAGAVISHASAAVLWGIVADGQVGADVHVTVIDRKCRSRPGLCAHRTAHLDPRDLRRINGLAVTAPVQTLLDLAASGWRDLERAFGEAHAQGLVGAGELVAAVKRWGRRAGIGAIRALMSDNASGFTRSRAERRLRRVIRSARLPEPRFNVPFGNYELDAVWQDRRLVVEVDGYGAHGHRAAFERDRRKDMALVTAGYEVIRVSWHQLNEEPLTVVAVIAAALGRGRRPG